MRADADLLTQSQAAVKLGRSPRWIRTETAAGRLPHIVDDNGRTLYSTQMLDAWQRRLGELAAERSAS